jgi:hypothetical protein
MSLMKPHAVSWSGLSRPSIHQPAPALAEGWILGTSPGMTACGGARVVVIPEFREAKYPGPSATSMSVEFVAPGSRLFALSRFGRDDKQ